MGFFKSEEKPESDKEVLSICLFARINIAVLKSFHGFKTPWDIVISSKITHSSANSTKNYDKI